MRQTLGEELQQSVFLSKGSVVTICTWHEEMTFRVSVCKYRDLNQGKIRFSGLFTQQVRWEASYVARDNPQWLIYHDGSRGSWSVGVTF
ncbi:hypothetical protein BABINDRAFT_160597, partial [Babjeviella inositovora NRRL Y-12698]